jgi:hypothetical protein
MAIRKTQFSGRMMQFTIRAVALLPPFVLFSFIGCSGSKIERATVSGRATLDGQAIPKGIIRFILKDGPTWSAEIVDGVYTTAGSKGAPVGELRVEVEAFRVPEQWKNADVSPEDLPLEQYVPERFNRNSELKMTIEHGNSNVEKDFELTTK